MSFVLNFEQRWKFEAETDGSLLGALWQILIGIYIHESAPFCENFQLITNFTAELLSHTHQDYVDRTTPPTGVRVFAWLDVTIYII